MKTISRPTEKTPSYLPHEAISPRTAVWSVLTGVALAMPVSALISLLPIPAPDADMLRVSATRVAPLYVQPWVPALHGLLIAPLWEEGVYRGLMLHMLRRYVPTWLAVAVPTLIFAGTHFTFSYHNAIFAAAVGLVFSGLALRSRSLFPAILCHSGVNLSALFVLRPIFEAAGLNYASAWTTPLALLMLGSSAALLVAGVKVLREESTARETKIGAGASLPMAAA